MSNTLIEQELVELKKRVEVLEKSARPNPQTTWKEAFGAMKGDPLLRKAARLGATWRKQENRRK